MPTFFRHGLLAGFAFCVLAAPCPAGGLGPETSDAFLNDPKFKKSLPPENWVVLRYCFDNRGKQVGDGECATLAAKALRFGRAKKLPPYGLNADYVWGELVGTAVPGKVDMGKVKPGDILQLRNVKIVARTANGGLSVSLSPHHTAIVVGLKNGGKTLTVLHQNSASPEVPPALKKTVHFGTYPLTALKAGWVKAYRPIPLTEAAETKIAYDDPVAVEVYRLINAERTARGLKVLQLNPQVGAAALALSKKMADGVRLHGEDVGEALLKVGYLDARNNLLSVTATAANAKGCVQAWMQSERSQKLLLTPDFIDVGVYLRRREDSVICCLILAKPE